MHSCIDMNIFHGKCKIFFTMTDEQENVVCSFLLYIDVVYTHDRAYFTASPCYEYWAVFKKIHQLLAVILRLFVHIF